ncbi:MAG: hypothetical protein ACF8SC_01305 [Phycisphaerales bacterium JB037]
MSTIAFPIVFHTPRIRAPRVSRRADANPRRRPRGLAAGYRLLAWRHLRKGHLVEARAARDCSDALREDAR